MLFAFNRQKQVDACRLVRRLIDRTSPNLPPSDGESRLEQRSNRTLPVILAPVEHGDVVAEDAIFAVTKDLTDHGLALVLNHPFQAEAVVVGFWCEHAPCFFLGDMRKNTRLGGGFWQLGIELRELLNAEWLGLQKLTSQAVQLLPDAEIPA
jgi:hypothetical protein